MGRAALALPLQIVQIEVRREGGLRLGGLLRRGLLRHVDDHSFPEDPLRVLRGAQFAARFGFTVENVVRQALELL